MATHDYVIANASGAAVRADLNNALAAIVSNNSSTTEPATTYAYMWWADTTSGQLKQRNAANDGWVVVRELDGTILMEDGTAAAPGLAFASDSNSGFFSAGADRLGIATNGIERVEFGTSEVVFNDGGNDIDFRIEGDTEANLFFVDAGNDRIGIGTASPSRALDVYGVPSNFGNLFLADTTAGTTGTGGGVVFASDNGSGTVASTAAVQGIKENSTAGNQDGALLFATKSGTLQERARIDSDGRLLVGTSSARTNFSLTAASIHDGLVQYETTSEPLGLSLCRNNSGSPIYLSLSATGGSSIGSTAPVSEDDGLGSIVFSGMNGLGAFSTAALISAEVDAPITASTSEMPGRLVFSTTADGESSPTERVTINQAGTTTFNATIGAGTNYKNIDGARAIMNSSRSSTSAVDHIIFINPNGTVGVIDTTGTSTRYITSSDYRLKENLNPLSGAIDRLNQLQVYRFNFIADPDTTVDGFLAHEAQAVVPECATGTKDEVDEDGNPVYQGIDQSKLVPLLTAALQEALQKIETQAGVITALDARLAALEGGAN